MEKGVLYINLMYRPLIGDNIVEHDANGGGFHHRAEGVIIINSWLLMITLGDKSRLSSFKRAIRPAFGFENPHGSDYIETRCGRDKDHVPFLMSAVNSLSIAARHSRCFEASE